MLESYKPDIQSCDLKLRLENLESEYSTFTKIQPGLDTAGENGIYLRERIETKHYYMRCCSRAYDLLQSTHNIAATEANLNQSVTDYSSQFMIHAGNTRFDNINFQ